MPDGDPGCLPDSGSSGANRLSKRTSKRANLQGSRSALGFSLRSTEWFVLLERVAGIEPAYSAWKAAALPLSYTRIHDPRRWWRELDLNQRRRSQRIYSPSPLTTRASLQTSRQGHASKMDSLTHQASRAGQSVGKAPSADGVMTARGSRVNTDRDKNREFLPGRLRCATAGCCREPENPCSSHRLHRAAIGV
jgi:hypothetical protein